MKISSMRRLIAVLLVIMVSEVTSRASDAPPLIGYTEGRNNLEGGQYLNWKTNLACVVRADGHRAQGAGGGADSERELV